MNDKHQTLDTFLAEKANNSGIAFTKELLEELTSLLGSDAVLKDKNSIIEHSYDTWSVSTKWKNQGKNFFPPDVVVKPNNTEQVSKLLNWATRNKIPVTPWGGGSSVTGQPLATQGGISLDMSNMDQVLSINDEALMVKVQAGKFGHILEEELNRKGYTLNHSPQSLDRSTVGGWIATRAMGQFSSRYGGIEDLAVSFTVVLPTGDVVKTMHAPRGAVGPDLRHIFMGAEGTTGVVTEVTLKIFPIAEFQIFETVVFDTVEAGVGVMRQIMRKDIRPFLVRFYDPVEAKHAMQDKSFNQCAMFLGFQGVEAIARAEYDTVIELCKSAGGTPIGKAPTEAWMARRYDYSTVEALLDQSGGLAETIEIAHFWDQILATYYELKEAVAPYADEVLGHFSHIYPQGTSLYVILLGKAKDNATAEENLKKVWDIAMAICLKNGAVISHHHGCGLARGPYIEQELGGSMQVLRTIKNEIDPAGIMNPGKLNI